MANKKYQTLSQFITKPMHTAESLENDNKLDMMYRKLISSKGVKLEAVTEVEKSYYYHIKIKSDSQEKQGNDYWYDVVIRFFTDDPTIEMQNHLKGYYIQFYSNSPSFVYQYAYLYKREGFLIEELYGKLDKETLDNPPKVRNSAEKLSYDKSLYCACRFLSDGKFRLLNKNGTISTKKKNSKEFFKAVSDWQSVRFDQELLNSERKLSKTLEQTKQRQGLKNRNKTSNTTSLVADENGNFKRRENSINRITPKKKISGRTKTNVSIIRKSPRKKTGR